MFRWSGGSLVDLVSPCPALLRRFAPGIIMVFGLVFGIENCFFRFLIYDFLDFKQSRFCRTAVKYPLPFLVGHAHFTENLPKYY